MSTWLWAMLLRPVGLFVFVLLSASITWLLINTLPAGWVKDWILRPRQFTLLERWLVVLGVLLLIVLTLVFADDLLRIFGSFL